MDIAARLAHVRFTPDSDRFANIPKGSLSAISDNSALQQNLAYSITSSAAREANGTGDVVYTMPDEIFCRHMFFDNVTAQITEDSIERCAKNIAGNRPRPSCGFAWHTN